MFNMSKFTYETMTYSKIKLHLKFKRNWKEITVISENACALVLFSYRGENGTIFIAADIARKFYVVMCQAVCGQQGKSSNSVGISHLC